MELISLSLNIQESDELIMPSYNFVGVANSFANLGARLVFADIDPHTMNIDSDSIARAVTDKTRAVVVMHYGGVSCNMTKIVEICQDKNLVLIEDNAQGFLCSLEDRYLGSFGDFSVISFGKMKNISCGEGGVLLYKEERHEQIIDVFYNGTNRSDFERGIVKKYEWTGKGSKFDLGEFAAAVLFPLLENGVSICAERRCKWDYLYKLLLQQEETSSLVPRGLDIFKHQGHVFYIKCKDEKHREYLINGLAERGIASAFHFSPIHASPYAQAKGYVVENDYNTILESNKILRLPIYNAITFKNLDYISEVLFKLCVDERKLA